MPYDAPIPQITHTLQRIARLDELAATGAFPNFDPDLVAPISGELLIEAFEVEPFGLGGQVGDRPLQPQVVGEHQPALAADAPAVAERPLAHDLVHGGAAQHHRLDGEQAGARVVEGYPTEPPPGKTVIWDEASVGLLQSTQ